MSKDDGYIHVANFVEVVHYPKDQYKGVKKYEVKQGDKLVESESEDSPETTETEE